ncbi:hypothetical protein MBLNU459_g8098t1 [Dothideomycetes sp. NU459]
MKSTIFATAALVAGAAADTIGSAIVINKCTYDVYLANTPAADGGYSEVDKTLSPNDQYSQQYTELTNGDGWSLKLSNSSTNWNDILQYEYTFHNDGTIWYDLSEVNGNPWDGNWEITSSTSSCAPKQQAYRYATDDAYGMQSCPDSATITVTLCSGESQDDAGASSASSSVAVASSSAAAAGTNPVASTTEVAPSSAFTTATPTSSKVVSTTLATSVVTSAPASSGSGDVVVTVTRVATTTYWTHQWGPPSKRDVHQHHHAARHPHQRE